MWRWRKIRYAEIPSDLKDMFELYGEEILVAAENMLPYSGMLH
jgi:hypothetical protein